MSILRRTQAAQAVHDNDRREFLHSLTNEHALRIYLDLCRTWEDNPNKQGIERLEHRRIVHLLVFRKKMDKIGVLAAQEA